MPYHFYFNVVIDCKSVMVLLSMFLVTALLPFIFFDRLCFFPIGMHSDKIKLDLSSFLLLTCCGFESFDTKRVSCYHFFRLL